MRRATTRVTAWLAVTAAAVALSWYAVRTVLRDTVFEPPRAPALAADTVRGPAPDPAADNPTISATSLPAPPSTTKPPPPASPAHPAPPAPPASSRPTASPTPSPPDQTRSFEVKGGWASFTFRPDSASLIAATPDSGWAVKVWPGDRWLRVDFTRGGRTSSVFVTWNDHPPLAETYES
ncbi:hypothetical protein [Yinghuangia sp. YIM S09857]|uniref:hypothetical protein n=1 Tax=Yinghuangia sp. YIM S09857 TaxID=3436929 RepID=UPI003F53A5D0